MKRLSFPLFPLLLLPLLLTPSLEAQERSRIRSQADDVQVTDVSFESTLDLLAEGWEEVSADVWRKTTPDGVEQEIALGEAGYQRAFAWLDAEIEGLRALETRRDAQALRLFELLLQQDLLAESAKSVEHTDNASKPVCAGTARFEHTYGWASLAYGYAEAFTKYTQWQSLNVDVTTYARASVCDGSCTTITDSDTSSDFIVTSFAYADYPSWNCTASAYGYVHVPYSGGGCNTMAAHSSSWSC